MFCENCGSKLDENLNFCSKCGSKPSPIKTQEKYNTLSIIGVVVACISLLLNFWGVVGIGAVVLSSLGLIQVKETGEKGKRMAIGGIVIGSFSIIYAFVLVLYLMM